MWRSKSFAYRDADRNSDCNTNGNANSDGNTYAASGWWYDIPGHRSWQYSGWFGGNATTIWATVGY